METYIFNIASHYACAIVNADYTGLEDNEERELNDFLDYLKREYGTSYLELRDYETEGDFNRCDISNLMGNCLQFNLEVQK
jgi:hypothetical protein